MDYITSMFYSDLVNRLFDINSENKIEVISIGVGSYSTENQIAVLQEHVLKFDPDLIILGFFINDFYIVRRLIRRRLGCSSSKTLIKDCVFSRPLEDAWSKYLKLDSRM